MTMLCYYIMLWHCVMLCMCHSAVSTNRIPGNQFDEAMKASLDFLCPGVDICNTSAPFLNTNDVLGDGRFVSCCRGCSCHEDCHIMMNCCFPRDEGKIDIETHLNDQEPNGPSTSKPSADGIESNRTNPEIIPNGHIESNETSSPNPLTDMVVGEPNDESPSVRQCLYARTDDPNDYWTANVPAYVMVTKPPAAGCKANKANNRIQTEADDILEGSCDSAVEAWSDLFPVYSPDSRTIYKNELCAQCHGQGNYILWTPTLVCEEVDNAQDRTTSVTEHFAFLEQKPLSNLCFLSFEYEDPREMEVHRCYVNTKHTCRYSSYEDFNIPSGLTLTPSEIVTACHSGMNAPFQQIRVVYRNVFCALCNVEDVDDRRCERGVKETYERNKLTYKMSALFLAEKSRLGQRESKTLRVPPHPEACILNDRALAVGDCRMVYCPSGQIRDNEGACKFPSKLWYKGSFLFGTKLNYVGNQTSILTMVNAGLIDKALVSDLIREANPWPSYWKIYRIFHSVEALEKESSIAIELFTEIIRPTVLVNDIRKSTILPWKIQMSGTNFTFKQSILEQSDFLEHSGTKYMYSPGWKRYADKLNLNLHIPKSVSSTWTLLYRMQTRTRSIPYLISKLLTCEHVSLNDGEYSIMANNFILTNNLTGRVMFDREFDLVENENGTLVPRVCLADTPLVLKIDTNSAPSSCGIFLAMVLVLQLLSSFVLISF